MNTNFSPLLGGALIGMTLLCSTILLVTLYRVKRDTATIDRLTRQVQSYESLYKVRQGYRMGVGKYHLLRLDDGGWYARTPDGYRPSEQVFPGLVEELEGWDRLSAFVERNGPLDPTNPAHVKLLNGAGITVTLTRKEP